MKSRKFMSLMATLFVIGLASCSVTVTEPDDLPHQIYKEAINNKAFEGTYEEWLQSLKGPKGDKGDKGDTGGKGDTGAPGVKGDMGDTGQQGIQGPKGEAGDDGEPGKSAYELYVEQYPGYIWGQEQWIKDLGLNQLKVVISFDTSGGDYIEPLVYCKGEEVKIDQIATKEHGAFTGWYSDNECLDEIEYEFVAKESITLYAGFDYDALSVTFMNDGAIYDVVATNYYSIVEEPTKPTKLGYTFLGWKEEDLVDYFDFSKPLIDGDVILNAVYDYDFLEIPAVVINTNNNTPIVDRENYIKSKVSILNTKEDWELQDISAGIRGRGNSTWGMPKKGYRIKFDKKQSVLGSTYTAKSWTLIANYSDKTLSRNYIAYELSKQFDDLVFSSCHHFVDLYLNDEYLGVYLLCDQIQTGTGRVDIDESIAEDGNNGFLLERDARASGEGEEGTAYFMFNGEPYVIKTPDTESQQYLDNKVTEIEYIKGYLDQCWSAITSNDNWEDVESLVDTGSFADQYIIDELFANNDGGWASCFFYKDKDGKLTKGPVWDFDIGAGNVNYNMGNADECLPDQTLYSSDSTSWYHELLKREEFVGIVKDKLVSYKNVILDVVSLCDSANEESLYNVYKKSIDRNFIKWNILGVKVSPEPKSVYEIDTVSGQFDYLCNWLLDRYVFVCEQYGVSFEPETPDAYLCQFNIDEGVEKIFVYDTSDYTGDKIDSLIGYSRDSSTGEYLKDGSGQINFTVVLKDGYSIDSINVDGTYKNLKGPADTLLDNTYRITKVGSDLEVGVMTSIAA